MAILRCIGYSFLGLACLFVLGIFSGFIVCSKHTVYLINKSSKTWYTSFGQVKDITELAPGQQAWTSGYMITLPDSNSKQVANRIGIVIADNKPEVQPGVKKYVIDFETPNMQAQTITACIQEDGTLVTQEGYIPTLVDVHEPVPVEKSQESQASVSVTTAHQ